MNKSKLGWILLSGASIAAMSGLAAPAYAQDDANAPPTEEIVVTATGRSAAIQDVPLAVTAVPAQQIENTGANDLRDLTQLAPSFNMGTGQSNTSGTIAHVRGIGTGSDNPGFEGAVGIFIDGVYRARAGAALADLPDLQRVEILRGPQGTLFGRNTSAGAISVVTTGPESDPGMALEAGYGFDDLHQGNMKAMVNVPLTDTFALRVDGSIRARDGYITDDISGNDINSTDVWTGRAQALWDITPNASLRVIFDSSRSSDECCGVSPLLTNFAGSTHALITQLESAEVGALLTPLADNPESRTMRVTPGRDFNENSFENGVSAQLDWDLGWAQLTSITSNRRWRSDRDQDVDFTAADIAYRDGLKVGFNNFTQEVRLQGESGPLNWLVGAFYGDEDLLTTDTIRTGSQTSQYTSFATIGGTAAPGSPFAGVGGCELNNFTPLNSIFQCAVGLLPGAVQPAMLAAVNSVNGGYLAANTSGQGQQGDFWTVNTKNWSLFTHDEFNISDNLVLTVGVRYNHEKKELFGDLNATGNECATLRQMEAATSGIIGAQGIVHFLDTVANGAFSSTMNLACNPAVNTISNGNWNGDASENEWTGTGSLAYHLDANTMVYAGYSRGYKAGGFNVDRSGFNVLPETVSVGSCATPSAAGRVCVDDLHFNPEFTDSFEAGFKSSPFGRGSTFNVTAFYEQIHDYQLNAFNGFNFITRNVPEVISEGVEVEGSVRPMAGLNLTAGVTYNDAHYDSTVRFNSFTSVQGDADPNAVFSGDPLADAPKWVVTGGVSYEMPIAMDMHALFYLDGRWNTEYRTQTLGRQPQGLTDNGSYGILNGRVALGPNSDHWSVELWVRNLTDQFYYVGAFSPPLQNDYVIFPSEPRTYGVTLKARW